MTETFNFLVRIEKGAVNSGKDVTFAIVPVEVASNIMYNDIRIQIEDALADIKPAGHFHSVIANWQGDLMSALEEASRNASEGKFLPAIMAEHRNKVKELVKAVDICYENKVLEL